MFKNYVFLFFTLFTLNFQLSIYADNKPVPLNHKDEISLTVLSYMCSHLEGRPISLKVFIDGGVPGYTLYADGLVVGQLSDHEFIILGLRGGEGVNVTVTDALGNSADFWAEAFIMPVPGADAGTDKYISCFDSLAILDGSSETENVRFDWSGPDPEIKFNSQNPGVSIPGMYYLTVISMDNGCRSYDSTEVFLPENPEFEFSFTPIKCFGDHSGLIAFEAASQGNPPYTYSIDGGSTFSQNAIFDNLSPGLYELILQDQLGCRADTMLELSEADSLILEIESSIVMQYGELYQVALETNLAEENIFSISWTPKEGLSCYDCLEPLASPENSIIYQLKLVDSRNCSLIDSLLIIVEKEKDVYIANAFTPNGDNLNDVFFIKGAKGVESIISLEIFNRWGNKVFEINNVPPNDANFGWDGRYRGLLLPPDVFVYLATVQMYDGEEEILSGDLTLIW